MRRIPTATLKPSRPASIVVITQHRNSHLHTPDTRRCLVGSVAWYLHRSRRRITHVVLERGIVGATVSFGRLTRPDLRGRSFPDDPFGPYARWGISVLNLNGDVRVRFSGQEYGWTNDSAHNLLRVGQGLRSEFDFSTDNYRVSGPGHIDLTSVFPRAKFHAPLRDGFRGRGCWTTQTTSVEALHGRRGQSR